ncbi:hypothetical protein L830_3583 [Mycobacteroides abscessus MAB_082312_2258]|nr:hypothetical protein L830_3583 [Mycobacteroides abscessus MAB_082312_2258]
MSQSASSRRKGGLGRGLASLIPTAPVDGSSAPAGPSLGAAAADVVIGGGPARQRRRPRQRPISVRSTARSQ